MREAARRGWALPEQLPRGVRAPIQVHAAYYVKLSGKRGLEHAKTLIVTCISRKASACFSSAAHLSCA